MDGNRPPFWHDVPEANAPFASSSVRNAGLAIGDTSSLRPRRQRTPRAYARDQDEDEAEADPSDHSRDAGRRQQPVSVGLRVESALPAWLRYGDAGQPGGREARFPASSRGGFCPASGETLEDEEGTGLSSDARRPPPRTASPGGEGYQRAVIGNGMVGTRFGSQIAGNAVVGYFRAGIGSRIG